MTEMRSRVAILGVAVLALVLVVGLLVQEGATSRAVPTTDLNLVRTEAVDEFARGLTLTIVAQPTATPTATVTATSAALGPGTPSATPTCLGLRFVRDVTIPDNTDMTPAQVFTKTWQVANSGTCPWKPGFQVILTGGVAMGGSPFKLAQTVGPGGTIQVAIKMAAPTNVKGVVQGTWKMSDENGEAFGDYLSVVIVVGSGTPPSPTTQATRTP
jgi:Ig-like domain from next to BRCA1 gene